MSLLTFFLIAIGLSFDSFAVSVSTGSTLKRLHLNYALKFALFFGFFQSLMLIVGWVSGLTVKQYLENYSHWIAFILLVIIGVKMIYESTLMDKPQKNSTQGLLLVIGLAFATSIDALSVGISYSLLYFRILIPVLILGGVTFTASLAGILIGGYFGSFFQKKLEVIGGLILIAIGINILLQNYY